jgi:hypothetical protein
MFTSQTKEEHPQHENRMKITIFTYSSSLALSNGMWDSIGNDSTKNNPKSAKMGIFGLAITCH